MRPVVTSASTSSPERAVSTACQTAGESVKMLPRDRPAAKLCVLPDDQLRPRFARQPQEILDRRAIGNLHKAEEPLLPDRSVEDLIAGPKHPVRTHRPCVEPKADKRRGIGGRGCDRYHMPAALKLACERNHLRGVTERRLDGHQNAQSMLPVRGWVWLLSTDANTRSSFHSRSATGPFLVKPVSFTSTAAATVRFARSPIAVSRQIPEPPVHTGRYSSRQSTSERSFCSRHRP